jgi:hypothetical protein
MVDINTFEILNKILEEIDIKRYVILQGCDKWKGKEENYNERF